MTKSYDVIVVGAGPAGLKITQVLVEKGVSAVVLEKKSIAGDGVVCAGVVGTELFDRFKISKNSVVREIKTARLLSPYGTPFYYTEDKPFAYVINREKFDRELMGNARNAGADFHFNTEVKDVVIAHDGVKAFAKCNDDEIEFKSRMLVLATGVNTYLSRKLKLGYSRRFLHAIQTEVSLNEEYPLTVYVGNEISDSAFAWLIPAEQNTFRIGLMCEDDCVRRFKVLTERYFPGIEFHKINVKPISQGITGPSFSDRLIAVGESAGQVKTTTGGGIYWGMLCAEIGGEVILDGLKNNKLGADFLWEYEKRWKSLIWKEIKAGLMVRKFCSMLRDSQIEKIIQLARTDGLVSFIKKNAEFDWHGRALFALLKMDTLQEIFKRS